MVFSVHPELKRFESEDIAFVKLPGRAPIVRLSSKVLPSTCPALHCTDVSDNQDDPIRTDLPMLPALVK